MKKLRVGILFGGRSGEHEVSLLSAASVLKAIDRKKYAITPIGITKAGQWVLGEDADALLASGQPNAPKLKLPKPSPVDPHQALGKLDVVFPILHGTFGEDGTMQGLFELAGVAYVGSGVLGSSAGMDKDVMKRLFASAGLAIPKHEAFLRAEWEASPRKIVTRIEASLSYPLFVKPANGGSSVGISKAHDRKELGPAIKLAAQYDRKIVVEQGIGGKGKARELEIAVLGNDTPQASVVGEVIPVKEFYDYEAKYLIDGSKLELPAYLSRAEAKTLRAMAIAAFKACDCSGLARVDFLMEPSPDPQKAPRKNAAKNPRPPSIVLNEINTMPGFTSISMYPKLWAASGVAYPELIDRLIALAIKRHAERTATSYSR